jgi:hypothetical protein
MRQTLNNRAQVRKQGKRGLGRDDMQVIKPSTSVVPINRPIDPRLEPCSRSQHLFSSFEGLCTYPSGGPGIPDNGAVCHSPNESVLEVHKSFLNVDGTLGPITGIVLNKDTKPLSPLQAQVSNRLRKRQFLWYELVE